ncbi:pseudaminic acid cytidylyltransferase [Fluviicola sp.]|uniref:pseudaminic acid cytidylyltransferase n=1 Tax=Fluviicola sp. TaxID=1917219 RepID=UPI0031D22BAB
MIAIIPARGGSKRIPGKNIKPFFGKPIIARVIENVLKSGVFSTVFVSTDDEEIARIAQQCGAEVPVLRSGKNSDDYATTSDVLIEVLDYLAATGRNYDKACCMYPTSVLIEGQDLKTAYDYFLEKQASVLLACVAYSHPIQRSFTIKDHKVCLQFPQYINSRSQDLEKVYHDTGSFYFFDVLNFMETKTLWQEQIVPFIVDENKVQDIDTPEDWSMAEMKFKLMHHEEL